MVIGNTLVGSPFAGVQVRGAPCCPEDTLNSLPARSFTVEFFASPDGDPSGFGQGQLYLGNTAAVTDAAGNAGFDVSLPASVPAGWTVTATATLEPTGATSEFSAGIDLTSAVAPPVVAEGMKLLDGLQSGGALTSLHASDDEYLYLDPAPTSPSMIPAAVQVRLRSRLIGDVPEDVIQMVELFNYDTGQLELGDLRPAAGASETIVVSPAGDPSRFVHPTTGELTGGVTWRSDSFSGKPFVWSVDVDEAVWLIDP